MSTLHVPADPGAGPSAPGPLPATTRPVRTVLWAVGLGLLLLRLPRTTDLMHDQAAAAMADDLQGIDPSLIGLSVNVAVLVGVLVFAVVLALYLWFAGLLERRLVPEGLPLGGGQRIGLYTMVVGGLTVLSQGWALATGRMAEGPVEAAAVPAFALAAALLYRSRWRSSGPGRQVLVLVVAVATAALVAMV
ncbi:hypothetical protein [Kocuria aegyptia]|uniref:Yip1 domain-containing protein n=1 Tax=Kocuria aegyptia TaxID=330943 RepID=A0ABP4X1U0_9MICC